MRLTELLKKVVGHNITEAEFTEEFFRLFHNRATMSGAEVQCLDELVDDVNMAEHVSGLFDSGFVWSAQECLRLLETGASQSQIRTFFATNQAP